MKNIKISKSIIGINKPTYFIADIAANHDGEINKAIDLIYSCAEAGANAAKFQHFAAETIVSDRDLENSIANTFRIKRSGRRVFLKFTKKQALISIGQKN